MCPKRDIVNLKQFPINQAPAVTSSSLSIKHRFDSASRVPIHKSAQLGMPKPDLRSMTVLFLQLHLRPHYQTYVLSPSKHWHPFHSSSMQLFRIHLNWEHMMGSSLIGIVVPKLETSTSPLNICKKKTNSSLPKLLDVQTKMSRLLWEGDGASSTSS